MPKHTVFISYDYDHDRHYKNLLLAWDKSKEFDFTFYDSSVDVSVDSNDPAAVRRVISARINGSTRFLCIVGQHTHKSTWVDWEINKAIELKKKLVGVKVDRSYTTPSALLGVGASWALSFAFDSIKDALK
jgi:hypothetical protein